jgi:superfamily II DNA or RNA helicase
MNELPADMPVAYPFGIHSVEMRKALKSFAPEMKVLKSNTVQRILWLPSENGCPIPSSPLIGAIETNTKQERTLKAFETEARLLSLEETALLTGMARERRSPAPGILFGNSIQWLAGATALALRFIEMEAFVPGIVPVEKSWESRWIPAPSEALFNLLCVHAQEMPSVFRCMSATPKEAPHTSPRTVLQSTLGWSMDGWIRERLAITQRGPAPESLHDAWVSSLESNQPLIRWNHPEEIAHFAAELDQWQRPINAISRAPFSFCFRINEPIEENDAQWEVEYLIHPREDPSLRISVADVWNNANGALSSLKPYGTGVIEFILTALSQAGGICAGVAESLKRQQPSGFSTDTSSAFRFLSEEAAVLRGAGFTVMLPSWWTGKTKKIGLRAKVKAPAMAAEGTLTLSRVMEFDCQAAMNGAVLTVEELEALARARLPLIQIRGIWTEVDPDQISKALKFLKKRGSRSMQATELIRIALGATASVEDIPIEGIDADGWLSELIDRLAGRSEFELLDQPSGLQGILRPYQLRGMSWLQFLTRWGLGACLADDMGLGKTIQTLALLERCREQGETRPVLLICPTSVINNWRKESEKFTPAIRTMIHHGNERHKETAFLKAVEASSLIISSYGLMVRDYKILSKVNWGGVILDEAQFIKNPATKQSKLARSIEAGFRIALTGTPVENHVGELWSLMDFLNPGWLGSQNDFKYNFHQPIQKYQDTDAAERLKKTTGPFILRRLKTDKSIIKDLPEKLETKDYCTLTQEQAALYRSIVADVELQLEQSEGIQRRGLILALLSRLKQVCNHPAHFLGDNSTLAGRSGKLERLTEILEEVREQNEGVLIFTQFTEMGTLLQRHLQETLCEEVLFFHGSLTRKARDAMVERFQNDTNGPGIIILSLKAAGTGLTLTRANHVIHYDRWWNPAVENQATDRAFRIGQKRNVQVHKFIVSGTLEEKIDEMIEKKNAIAGQVIGTGEDWLSELSNDDLRNLISLGCEATADL